MKGKEMKKTNKTNEIARFRLFSQEWNVRYGRETELDDELGLCLPDRREILIDERQNTDSKKHTLTHELIHAVEQKLLLNLTETQVDLLALGLLDLFKNNPHLMVVFEETGVWEIKAYA
jgi:Zn-dependent peptidase ImmA (M78 family)